MTFAQGVTPARQDGSALRSHSTPRHGAQSRQVAPSDAQAFAISHDRIPYSAAIML